MNKSKKGDETRRRIMVAIEDYINKHGYPPTVREIGEMVELRSSSSVFRHLNLLKKEGKLETDVGFSSPRAIRIPGYKFIKNE